MTSALLTGWPCMLEYVCVCVCLVKSSLLSVCSDHFLPAACFLVRFLLHVWLWKHKHLHSLCLQPTEMFLWRSSERVSECVCFWVLVQLEGMVVFFFVIEFKERLFLMSGQDVIAVPRKEMAWWLRRFWFHKLQSYSSDKSLNSVKPAHTWEFTGRLLVKGRSIVGHRWPSGEATPLVCRQPVPLSPHVIPLLLIPDSGCSHKINKKPNRCTEKRIWLADFRVLVLSLQ